MRFVRNGGTRCSLYYIDTAVSQDRKKSIRLEYLCVLRTTPNFLPLQLHEYFILIIDLRVDAFVQRQRFAGFHRNLQYFLFPDRWADVQRL